MRCPVILPPGIRRAVQVSEISPERKRNAEPKPKPDRKPTGTARKTNDNGAVKPKTPRKPRAQGQKPTTKAGRIAGTNVLYCKGGQLTPLEFYMECYRHQHEPIILDDANAIMQKDIGKRLLMSLTESRPVKTLDYRTTNKLLAQENVPTTFQTKSRVCYVSNSWLPEPDQFLDGVVDFLRRVPLLRAVDTLP